MMLSVFRLYYFRNKSVKRECCSGFTMFANILKYTLVSLVVILTGLSCKKEEKINNTVTSNFYKTTPDTVHYPTTFPPMFIAGVNPQTKEGVELGRKLYYDSKLSVNGSQQGFSCSSCHAQSKSFSVGSGVVQVLPHVNLGWNNFFLWEGKIAGTLEDIMKFEVEDFFQSDLSGIKSNPAYTTLYKNAFGTTDITLLRTEFALTQFFRTLTSCNSRFDYYVAHKLQLTQSEMNGFAIFMSEKGDCFHCHTIPLTTDNNFHNIGLDSVFSSGNSGRYNTTKHPSDIGLYKTPTLRNIELTAPYMHDGRFESLEEVVEHYNSRVKHSPTLDPIMTKPAKVFGLQLTIKEKADLVSFLKTLTDTLFISNPKLSNPN